MKLITLHYINQILRTQSSRRLFLKLTYTSRMQMQPVVHQLVNLVCQCCLLRDNEGIVTGAAPQQQAANLSTKLAN